MSAARSADPPDWAERERVRRDLTGNLLVEAGAGSGKTTALVSRMLALVESGVEVRRLAAVTFTRKAAGELSQKFRGGLEKAFHAATVARSPTAASLDRALREIDQSFIGTIHAFCATLLREHPLEARIDPGFTELAPMEAARLAREFWNWHLDARHAARDPILQRLQEVGLQAAELERAFESMLDDSDVVFPSGAVPPPDATEARRALLDLLRVADHLLHEKPSELPTDDLQKMLKRLGFLHRSTGWRRDRHFFAALQVMTKGGCKPTQKNWSNDTETKREVGRLGREFRAFYDDIATPLLEQWYAHRYSHVMEFLDPLVRDFQTHRRRTGKLTFQDLLQFAADLLREHPRVRARLGERFRHLLIDEFQDTDPLQAEVCLLLASDPVEGSDWRTVVPRPGSLFVVGDPKQSIYRFRRADIEVYDLVYRRFREFGDIVPLTANFRSVPVIGRFVDEVFAARFETGTPTPHQAAFAPMNTARPESGGVYRYDIDAEDGQENLRALAERDAEQVATWIARRLREGRSPQDFLILPFRKMAVEFYAAALERRGIPVTASGAGIAVTEELEELTALLRALADPQDEVATMAVLEGLFFGLDPADLWAHRAAGGFFSYDRAGSHAESPVGRALAQLARWSRLARHLPVDTALQAIAHEIGLLPLAAAREMGESRAGSLVHVLEAVGTGAIRGAADLRAAIEAVQAAMESPEIEAPLRPGRTDAVRVMNLHKAKGLQAPIVILPHPIGHEERSIQKHVRRTERGAEGYLRLVGEKKRILAQPLGWTHWETREREFQKAEFHRLLYVAATRAMDELVIARFEPTRDKSPWRELDEELQRHGERLVLRPEAPIPREPASASAEEVAERIQRVEQAREAAGSAAFRVASVTGAAKEELEFRGSQGKGKEWGDLVHQGIAAMGRGREADDLRRYCRALLRSAPERPVDAAGEPAELEDLLGLLTRVRESEPWQMLAGAGALWEVAVARLEECGDDPPQLVTGTIDALAIGQAGEPWRVVDWKTDVAEGEEWQARERAYARQVEAYRAILMGVLGVESQATVARVR
ncbi:MAG: UvrD-helicase domain-containing protein [Gemmatimonadetes bacterium]|nr:UvrD-helicase domain-containing protein [Gemmatimonadota bacterium]